MNPNRESHEAWFDNAIAHNKHQMKMGGPVVRYMLIARVPGSDMEWPIYADDKDQARAVIAKSGATAVYDLGFNKAGQLDIKGVWNL